MITKNKKNNIKRLLYLAREVAKTKPDKKVRGRPPFYFGTYANSNQWDGKNQKLSCGTTACAVGLASTLPTFRRLGLRLVLSELYGVQPYVKGHRFNIFKQTPLYKLFGLIEGEYGALFVPDSPPSYLDGRSTAKQVADNIRSFCKAALKNEENAWMNNRKE
jgi:hypothetical protein